MSPFVCYQEFAPVLTLSKSVVAKAIRPKKARTTSPLFALLLPLQQNRRDLAALRRPGFLAARARIVI